MRFCVIWMTSEYGRCPHGPHAVRDVLATHLLRRTGSYELASFAIQDSIESVVNQHARFMPHEKIARAAEVLNKVWTPSKPRAAARPGKKGAAADRLIPGAPKNEPYGAQLVGLFC